METRKLIKVPVTLGEYDPTYGTYVILEGITAESYLADPNDAGVREGAAVYLRGELEYMGQTEPPETVPAGSESGVPGETIGEIVAPVVEPEDGTPSQDSASGSDTVINLGSLVLPTEDPEKAGD